MPKNPLPRRSVRRAARPDHRAPLAEPDVLDPQAQTHMKSIPIAMHCISASRRSPWADPMHTSMTRTAGSVPYNRQIRACSPWPAGRTRRSQPLSSCASRPPWRAPPGRQRLWRPALKAARSRCRQRRSCTHGIARLDVEIRDSSGRRPFGQDAQRNGHNFGRCLTQQCRSTFSCSAR